MDYIWTTLSNLAGQTAFANLYWGTFVMIAVACVFLVLAIKFGFEPLLYVISEHVPWYHCRWRTITLFLHVR